MLRLPATDSIALTSKWTSAIIRTASDATPMGTPSAILTTEFHRPKHRRFRTHLAVQVRLSAICKGTLGRMTEHRHLETLRLVSFLEQSRIAARLSGPASRCRQDSVDQHQNATSAISSRGGTCSLSGWCGSLWGDIRIQTSKRACDRACGAVGQPWPRQSQRTLKLFPQVIDVFAIPLDCRRDALPQPDLRLPP